MEPGRYRLVVARACPWANRAIIVRRLLGLEDVLSIGFCGPTHDERSWTFDLDPGGVDPVLKIPRLQDAYFKRVPGLPEGHHGARDRRRADGRGRHQRLPADDPRPVHASGPHYHRDGAPQLYPEPLRAEIDEVAKRIYTEVNNGVYRCGFAGSQDAYDAAYDRLFTALDWLSERLAAQRFLVGDTITEADVRLFTTLARFDPVYHGHFKCNRQKLAEMPVLWAYARDLFQTPGFGDTIDFVQIKKHYYVVHADINPTQRRAEGAGAVQLADTARSGSVGRQAVRRRHAARADAARASGCPRATQPVRARPSRTDHSACGHGNSLFCASRTSVGSWTAMPVSRPRRGSTVGMVTASLLSGRNSETAGRRRPRRRGSAPTAPARWRAAPTAVRDRGS